MRSVRFALSTLAFVAGDGFIRGSSSFSVARYSLFVAQRRDCFRFPWSPCRKKWWAATRQLRLLDSDNTAIAQCSANDSSRSNKRGRERARRPCRRSTADAAGTATTTLNASSSPTASSSSLPAVARGGSFPSLDGLPGAGTPAAQKTTSSQHPPPQGGAGRSKRGKYPVIELYRHNQRGEAGVTGTSGEDENNSGSADYDDDPGNAASAALAAAARKGPMTAMQHLTSVLQLGAEQADLMLESFPALDDVHPDKLDLPAKLLFLRHTIGGDAATAVAVSFPQFFGHPLERHIAPRHAFLVANGRPSGERLLERGCRGLRRMLELPANRFVAEMVPARGMPDYRRFEQAFLRGPFDAARNGDAEILRLLRSHGWDCWETDRRNRTALFWAAGGGSIEACVALVEGEGGLRPHDAGGDGSTPLHWAAAGVKIQRFGTGGHVDVCRWLLARGADPRAATSEGNTVVMWAAWSGSIDTTRWAVEEADVDLGGANVNGCTVAHWASSGGSELVCRYLHSRGVDFTRQNKGGNDPLNHAVAYGRLDIAAWLLEEGQYAFAGGALARDARSGAAEHGDRDDGGHAQGRTRGAATASSARASSGRRARRRRDDPQLLDLARLTGDKKMEAFLLEGTR